MRSEYSNWHFTDDNFKYILLNEMFEFELISLKWFPEGKLGNQSSVAQLMVCRLFGDKPLPEPMMTNVVDAILHYYAVIGQIM